VNPILENELTKRLFPAFLAGFLLFASACAPVVEQTPPGLPAVTESPAAPASATPTIAWFPDTRTPTPSPTVFISPTLEPFPGLGQVIFEDDFSDPVYWTNIKDSTEGGNAALLGDNLLTLAINQTPASLFSVRKDLLLGDFYAETLVSLNRCSGDDAYGMLFRSAADLYAYRFILSCNGTLRVERLRGGESLPLADWLPSGDAPSGPPAEIRLGVWAAGSEFRFFVNGRYQLSVFDTLYKSGSLGVFARAASPSGMNVGFSQLTVQAVSYVSPTPTPTASRTPPASRTPRPTP
jgi:hypothetical protein